LNGTALAFYFRPEPLAAHGQECAPVQLLFQGRDGRLYLRRHFTADAVRQCYRNFSDGMIPDYLANRAQRDAALALA
jgi:hypothetical protein